LSVNRPSCPTLIVAGPPFVITSVGGLGTTTWIETLPEAVCAGLFQVTTPVLVTMVPAVSVLLSVARKRRSIVPPGASGP